MIVVELNTDDLEEARDAFIRVAGLMEVGVDMNKFKANDGPASVDKIRHKILAKNGRDIIGVVKWVDDGQKS